MELLYPIYFGFQRMLVPVLNEEMGPLSDKAKHFVAVCGVLRSESFIRSCEWRGNGRKPKSSAAIARAFLAKARWNFPTTRALIVRLRSDTSLRRLCGWDNYPDDVPDEATFFRAFAMMEFIP